MIEKIDKIIVEANALQVTIPLSKTEYYQLLKELIEKNYMSKEDAPGEWFYYPGSNNIIELIHE